jgi:hypothetical protein
VSAFLALTSSGPRPEFPNHGRVVPLPIHPGRSQNPRSRKVDPSAIPSGNFLRAALIFAAATWVMNVVLRHFGLNDAVERLGFALLIAFLLTAFVEFIISWRSKATTIAQ